MALRVSVKAQRKEGAWFDTRSRESSLKTGALASTNDTAGFAWGKKIAEFWASSHSKDEGSA